MTRNKAVMTWREVCGSDTAMAMMPPTGRMLEDFAARIEANERTRCAKLCDSKASHCDDADNYYGANAARDLADAIRAKI